MSTMCLSRGGRQGLMLPKDLAPLATPYSLEFRWYIESISKQSKRAIASTMTASKAPIGHNLSGLVGSRIDQRLREKV
jgi:hypothetical protein